MTHHQEMDLEAIEARVNAAEPWVIRKGSAFYRDKYAGYSSHPESAGIYTETEAKAEAARLPKEITAHRLSDFRAELVQNFNLARDQLAKLDARLPAHTVSEDGLRAEVDRLSKVIERDRSDIAPVLTAVRKAIAGHEWLRLGRGSYQYDDERWKDEFGQCIDDIEEALKPLAVIARDWTDCPTRQAEIAEARAMRRVTAPAGDGLRSDVVIPEISQTLDDDVQMVSIVWQGFNGRVAIIVIPGDDDADWSYSDATHLHGQTGVTFNLRDGIPQACEDRIRALSASPTKPEISGGDEARLNFIEQNNTLEISHGEPESGEEDDSVWRIHQQGGNRNDREWTLIAEAETLRDAIDLAIRRTKGDAA